MFSDFYRELMPSGDWGHSERLFLPSHGFKNRSPDEPGAYKFVIFLLLKYSSHNILPITKTRAGVHEHQGPALVCLSAIDKKLAEYCLIITMYLLVFLMSQNPKCPGYNQEKNQGDK